MNSVHSQNADVRAVGPLSWVMPFVLAVAILTLSWTGLFVVVSDLIQAASSFTAATDTVHE